MALILVKNMGDDDFLLLQLVLIMTEMFFLIFSGSASFSLKIQIINISGFGAIQPLSLLLRFRHRNMKAGIDNM